MLFQVPAQLPPEGGGAIYLTHSRHRGYGDTGGACHVVFAQPANLSQRFGHAQLRVSPVHLALCVLLSKFRIKSINEEFLKYVRITYRLCRNLIIKGES
jgi:hypothetical protein